MHTNEKVIAQTILWISKVVVGCNFCPFAARELKRGSIHYQVIRAGDNKTSMEAVALEFERLDRDDLVETSFLIFPDSFADFYKYLDMVDLSEKLLVKLHYEGIYQIASFHPQYLFAGASIDEASNFTNRSPFPMIQILREASVSLAVENYSHPEKIPEQNIRFANEKGLAYMRALRDSCLSGNDEGEFRTIE